jgi:hypothetical protein
MLHGLDRLLIAFGQATRRWATFLAIGSSPSKSFQ